jgi:hypothetical protein
MVLMHASKVVPRIRRPGFPGKPSEEEDLMSPQDYPTGGPVQTYAEQRAAETPFVQTSIAAPEEIEAEERIPVSSWYEAEAPFRDEGGTVEGYGPEAEEFAQFLAELRDEGFDEAVKGLANEASELYQEQLVGESGALGPPPAETERLLEAHFEPVVREAEMLLEKMAEDARHHDLTAMSEAEIDTLLSQYEVPTGQFSPNSELFLENFLGKLKRVVKGAVNLVKKGISVAATLGLGPILDKLKRFVRPLLKRVLKFALNKLPPTLRPAAEQLAKRFLGMAPDAQPPMQPPAQSPAQPPEEGGKEPTTPDQGAKEPAAPDPAQVQVELDAEIANLLFASEEMEQELAIAEYAAETERQTTDSIGELDLARAQFISEISELEDGKDPTPLLENFIPLAIQPLAKIAFKMIGRPRVVRRLARFLANLIGRYVGQEQAMPLSQAIVDAGLRLVNLEATPEARSNLAGSALAATVEETARRVAALPEDVLENEALLEGAIQEAFEGAVAASLPSALLKPRLRETTGLNGAWMFWPPRARRYRYRKYTLTPRVRITPQIARTIRTFGGTPLARVFRDRYGLPMGRSINARLHLYEAIPGTETAQIAKSETDVPGLGSYEQPAVSQFHPLTPEAATALLQEPELGRDVSAEYLASPDQLAIGERLYYLEIAGSSPQVTPAEPGQPSAVRRPSEVNLTLDFPRNRVQVYIFLSEAASQEIATMLRQKAPVGAVHSRLKAEYGRDLNAALSGRINRHVKMVHEAVPPDQFFGLGRAINRVHPIYLEWLRRKLRWWLRQRLAEYLQQQAQKLIIATEDVADGVTLVVTFISPPGLSSLRGVVGGGAMNPTSDGFPKGMPETSIEVVAGFQK